MGGVDSEGVESRKGYPYSIKREKQERGWQGEGQRDVDVK